MPHSTVPRRPMLISGELVESVSGRWITSVDPVDESPVGEVPDGTADDVDRGARRGWLLAAGERRGARDDGARLVTGGGVPEGERFAKGFWVQPTVFADVTGTMRIAREEVFGPILSILKWRTEEEALALANDVEFGLTAAIWTRDIGTALRTARAVEAGYLWVNGVGAHYPAFPYGGYKNSGIGREESLEELLGYTQVKAMSIIP